MLSGHFRKSSFQTAEEDFFSLGRECVRKWLAQKDWHTLWASNFCQNVYRTSALVEFESDLTMLQELWRSELLPVQQWAHWLEMRRSYPWGARGLCSGQWTAMRICASCMSRLWETGSACSPRLLRQEIALRQWGSHTSDACVSLWCFTNTPYPIQEFCARNAFRGLTKTCMSTLMVSEGYTWVGRMPTLEFEILAFLIRELVPNIHELHSMITERIEKNSGKARALEQVIVVASKPKTTAQRTPRDVPRALPEARDVPEPTPTDSASASEPAAGSQQLAARGAESADHRAAASERKLDGTLREIIGEESTREEASPSLLDGLLVLGMGGPHRADARRMPTELAVNSNARMCRKTSMLSPVSHHSFTSDMSVSLNPPHLSIFHQFE